jgi:hypothetical protein
MEDAFFGVEDLCKGVAPGENKNDDDVAGFALTGFAYWTDVCIRNLTGTQGLAFGHGHFATVRIGTTLGVLLSSDDFFAGFFVDLKPLGGPVIQHSLALLA